MTELYAMGRDMGLGDRLANSWKEQLELSYNFRESARRKQGQKIKIYRDSRKYRALVTNRVSWFFHRDSGMRTTGLVWLLGFVIDGSFFD